MQTKDSSNTFYPYRLLETAYNQPGGSQAHQPFQVSRQALDRVLSRDGFLSSDALDKLDEFKEFIEAVNKPVDEGSAQNEKVEKYLLEKYQFNDRRDS
jgi:hypothetical protein